MQTCAAGLDCSRGWAAIELMILVADIFELIDRSRKWPATVINYYYTNIRLPL